MGAHEHMLENKHMCLHNNAIQLTKLFEMVLYCSIAFLIVCTSRYINQTHSIFKHSTLLSLPLAEATVTILLDLMWVRTVLDSSIAANSWCIHKAIMYISGSIMSSTYTTQKSLIKVSSMESLIGLFSVCLVLSYFYSRLSLGTFYL